ncbi:DUF3047 domain-containing protein [Vibrio maerlii]|uniref:DUF3047 domain-containing protein n=1 Tax=Vibrio maerlii TaxID=2231648 RepID=UPI000E3E78E3|nr:DUF3047 domain-containing protein [Vibrio maerlii]
MKNWWSVLALTSFFAHSSEMIVELPKFNEEEFHQWEAKIFSGETNYKILSSDDVLHAQSEGAASGLVFRQRIDIHKTPYINWSWKIDNKLKCLPEDTKEGDDYAARIYLVRNGTLVPWNARAINYVWSCSSEMGQQWDNPFAGSKVKMLSVRDGSSGVGEWYAEKRNVFQDMIDVFGDKGSKEANQKSYRYIDVVALMTDTDNSSSSAESYYGSITFSSE